MTSPGPDAGSPPDPAAAVADAHRREWAFVLAATARVAGDIDLAEECVQDAYVAALDAWSRQGVPRNPGAWLTTTARRRAIDALRREATLRGKLRLLAEPELPATGSAPPPAAEPGEDDMIPDDRLRLVFTCCHPALGREAQVALTLRLVCGLTTTEIAQAFLVPEPTMAARVTRAKKKISAARIAYRVPGAAELPDRLDAVLTVLHLLYTTGHMAPAGENVVRDDIVERALDLARMLHSLMPDEREVRGLLALLLLTDARRATRADADGRLLLLADQDRSRWDQAAIAEGGALVVEALRGGRPGRFALQAAIAAVHAEAPSYATDQMRNPDMVAGYEPLGEELLRQVDGAIHTFCAAVGTAGMLVGASRALKRRAPQVQVVAFEPATSAVLSGGTAGRHGVGRVRPGFVPAPFDRDLVTRTMRVDEDEGRRMAWALARREGIFAGTSTGLNVAGAIALAREIGAGHTVVTVAVDSGFKYLAGDLYAQEPRS